jgi:hypothetical protein
LEKFAVDIPNLNSADSLDPRFDVGLLASLRGFRVIDHYEHLPLLSQVIERCGWACAICGAVDDRNTAIEFTLCETFGWKVFERTQHIGFMNSLNGAIRLDFILQPSAHPDLLPFASLD